MIHIRQNGKKSVEIEIPIRINELIKEIQQLPNSKGTCLECGKSITNCQNQYHMNQSWVIPITFAETVVHLTKQYYHTCKVSAVVLETIKQQKQIKNIVAYEGSTQLELPGGKLYPFQAVGVSYLEISNGCCMLADEPGLGKSLQLLAFISKNNFQSTLVVTPASITFNWAKEAFQWLANLYGEELFSVVRNCKDKIKCKVNDVEVSILNGGIVSEHALGKITIISYSLLNKWVSILKKHRWDCVVADEAHLLKNHLTKRAKLFNEIAQTCSRRVLITGTPIPNKPEDSWSLLNIIDSETWSNRKQFKKRYNTDDKEILQELHERLKGHVWIRRLKKDVLKELPEKISHDVYLNISDRAIEAYKNLEYEVGTFIAHKGHLLATDSFARGQALGHIVKLRSSLGIAKTEAALQWLRNLLESVNKVVIFAHHERVVDAISYELNALTIKGATLAADRLEIVNKFQTDPNVRTIVCSILASGTGITLTAASHVVFVEQSWRAGDMEQASDRIHRIGQLEKAIVWNLYAINTFDEAMKEVIDYKAKNANIIHNGIHENNSQIDTLIKYFEKNRK